MKKFLQSAFTMLFLLIQIVAWSQKPVGKVFPNPAQHEVTVSHDFLVLHENYGQKGIVRIFSAHGILMFEQRFSVADKKYSFKLPDLENGCYYLYLEANGINPCGTVKVKAPLIIFQNMY